MEAARARVAAAAAAAAAQDGAEGEEDAMAKIMAELVYACVIYGWGQPNALLAPPSHLRAHMPTQTNQCPQQDEMAATRAAAPQGDPALSRPCRRLGLLSLRDRRLAEAAALPFAQVNRSRCGRIVFFGGGGDRLSDTGLTTASIYTTKQPTNQP